MTNVFSLRSFLKKNLKIIVLALIVLFLFLSPINEKISFSQFSSLIISVQGMRFASLVFVLVYILGVVLGLPGIAFMFLAGSLFGFWKGFALSFIASNIGCQFTFFISRFMGRDFINRFFSFQRLLGKISGKIEEKGFMVMLYLRLIPLFPFNLVNYTLGLTNISHRDYTLGTLVGKIPAMAIYIFISSSFHDFADSSNNIPVYAGVFILFTISTILLEKKQKVFK